MMLSPAPDIFATPVERLHRIWSFSSKTLEKLNATSAILERLGISYEETMAIGDSSSDLGIIKACGVGVAMGNAPEEIKAAADAVTDTNTEDGLAKAFEKFVL